MLCTLLCTTAGSLLCSPLVACCGGSDWMESFRVFAVGHQLHHLRLQRHLHGSGTTTRRSSSHTNTQKTAERRVPLIITALGSMAQPPIGSLSYRTPPRGSLGTFMLTLLGLLPPEHQPSGVELRHLSSSGHPRGPLSQHIALTPDTHTHEHTHSHQPR